MDIRKLIPSWLVLGPVGPSLGASSMKVCWVHGIGDICRWISVDLELAAAQRSRFSVVLYTRLSSKTVLLPLIFADLVGKDGPVLAPEVLSGGAHWTDRSFYPQQPIHTARL